MSNESSWQDYLKTWKSRVSYLYRREEMSDITIIVGADKQKIPAHKFVLGASSSDLYSSFFSKKSNKNGDIVIPDVPIDIVNIFVLYIYREEINLNLNIVWDILKLSSRFGVKHLEKLCDDFLHHNVTDQNVFDILDTSTRFQLPQMKERCMEIICQNPNIFMENSTFFDISRDTLEEMLSSELLPTPELEIFHAVNSWSDIDCQKKGLALSSENKRLALGPAIYKIRFASMTFEEFTDCTTVGNSFLNHTETIEIFQSIGTKSACDYSGVKRWGQLHMQICDRFDKVSEDMFCGLGGRIDFNFTVDKTIFCCGFGIYGRIRDALRDHESGEVFIKILDKNDYILNESQATIKYDGRDSIYKILFKTPLLITPNKMYSAYVERDGPIDILQNHVGVNGKTEIQVNGVLFKISKSLHEYKFDTSTRGSTAAILFKNL